mmetsp:Transcript_27023/g.64151  ORF Transcript_27023/g.64151 Transcript_27023/m.64151 type:complete len:228 (+) Transcript_27023:712-1395(+)
MHCFHAFEISRDVLFREAEICNFRCPISWIFWPFAHHDDVRRFDIPMTDSILMQKRHCIRELPHHVEASPFWDGPSFLNPHPQVTTFPSLLYDMDGICSFKCFEELDAPRMLDSFHAINFFSNSIHVEIGFGSFQRFDRHQVPRDSLHPGSNSGKFSSPKDVAHVVVGSQSIRGDLAGRLHFRARRSTTAHVSVSGSRISRARCRFDPFSVPPHEKSQIRLTEPTIE